MSTEPQSAPDDGMTPPEPSPEHLWLLKLTGEWTFTHEAKVEPGQPPMTVTGGQVTRAIGKLWIVGDGWAQAPGSGDMRSVITLGFDPVKQRFVGSFIASMMTHMWPYEGTLDAAGKVLTLDSEGPSFTDPTAMAKYQDIFELVSDDHYILRSITPGPDGERMEFMTAHYHRRHA